MLIGEFESKITENNRIALPKKFRDELGADLIVMNGYEGCLIIVNKERFTALTKEIVEGRFINDAVRDTTRFLIGSAQEVNLDKQGRFVLPQSLIDYSGISIDGIFLGLLNWVEIWDKEKWNERKSYITQNSSDISAKLDQSLKTN
jgi:MraZ protein